MAFCDLSHIFHKQVTNVSPACFCYPTAGNFDLSLKNIRNIDGPHLMWAWALERCNTESTVCQCVGTHCHSPGSSQGGDQSFQTKLDILGVTDPQNYMLQYTELDAVNVLSDIAGFVIWLVL